ncbi:MFS transporter [Halalkalibacillus sediminis]|uniref:MFS transporter n=1 Tax=Halalkalibacillus sediminis TaxID=2018042 RepID=A0A2I0QWD0_9BACI|nr:MFS transporter [Halalkalibacillus sediminis]PKR78410.1 MFS transporter [Halalkalibacillus sediminis]
MTEEQKLQRATFHLWTFAISKLISIFGNSIYTFGISLFVLTLTGSATSFAINLICSVVPRTLLSPIAGSMADRYSKKKIVILSQIFAVLIVSFLLGYSLLFELNLVAIYITTAFLSVTTMFTSLTFTSSIANLIDDTRIQRAMAINQSASSAAAIGGPVIGGILFGVVSMNAFLIIFIVSFSIAVILEATMNFKLFTKNEGGEIEHEKMFKSILSGFHYLRKDHILWVIVSTALIINFFFTSLLVGLPFIVIEELGIKSQHFGVIEAMIGGGILLASLYFSIRKDFKYPLVVVKNAMLLVSLLLSVIALPLLVNMSYLMMVIFFISLTFLIGVTLTFVNTPVGVMIQKGVDENYRGRIFGILETMAQAMVPIGMIVYGLLYDYVSPAWILIASSACLILVTAYMIRPSVLRKAYPSRGDEAIQTKKFVTE